ncbi:unnamed protein product [Paramecium sonneborni]|uniref:Uncharacterized protein n=1 Tax=Paramecium sonneborni TaxID=65129 RepID=A0A8S1NYC9_9CILI|nr:unnamed protein product [Paramecium sonneborni]
MNEQEFMKQTAQIFCQDPKIRQSQCIDQRMQLYDEILCKTLGKVYPVKDQTFNQDCQLEKLPQQNTLLDSFIKNLLMSDKGAIFCYNQYQQNRLPQPKIQQNQNQQRSLRQHPNYQQYQQQERYNNNDFQIPSQQRHVMIERQNHQSYQGFPQPFNNSQLYHSRNFNQQNDHDNIYTFDIIEESKRRRIQQIQNYRYK